MAQNRIPPEHSLDRSIDAALLRMRRSESRAIRATIEIAKRGNVEAARDLLVRFSSLAKSTTPASWPNGGYPLALYLAQCFDEIGAGASGDMALHLTRPPRRPDGITTFPYDEIAAIFYGLVRRGHSKEEAKRGMEHSGIPRHNINRALKARPWLSSGAEIDAQISRIARDWITTPKRKPKKKMRKSGQ